MRCYPSKEPLHPLLVPVLLLVSVLLVYYPALLSGLHSIDDPGIISRYAASPPLSQILLPGGSYYYRPLVELSFWLDQRLWGLEPVVMHLENVLLHLANALLVYRIASRCLTKTGSDVLWLPLCPALLFALHPLNVEAVAWIAGRTDPILALFALSGCLFLLRWLEDARWRDALLAVFFFTLAALTKETAVALLPVSMLLVLMWPAGPGSPSRSARVRIVVGTLLAAVLFALSLLAFKQELMALRRFLTADAFTPLQAAIQLATALGFYVWKAFFPFPLNFAITEVSPWHALVALAGGVALALALKRRHFPALFFACAALLIAPALLLAVKNISWTPYAERYLYLPTAFISLGVGSMLPSPCQKGRLWIVPPLVVLLLFLGVASRQRAALWQDKIGFFQDAIVKSPRFGSLYNEIGVLLLQDNSVDAAARAFTSAERLNRRPAMDSLIRFNIMSTILAKGDYIGARNYFTVLFPAKEKAPVAFLELLQKADGLRLASLSAAERAGLSRDMMESFALLYRQTKDPFWLYREGQLARELKLYPQALELFRKAYQEAPADASYRLATRKQISGLEGMK
ncbi:ArnT family glycosyltransferase [Geoanaerobacter pelophilus]|uniref:ArnT family glycosyltransferase n=1 Tax=Geoanaerobacter pelophilus TaxID=60036 RepID=UPI00117A72C0|nr:glycosyltransferase family 39 protein [Geoanaerobacter pelophilus]